MTAYNLWIAFAGGILSFLSPCILPLIPVYLAVLSGDSHPGRFLVVLRTLVFVIGFTLVFTAMGLTASSIGRLLREYNRLILSAGGIIVIILGLHQLGAVHLLPLYRQRKFAMPKGGSMAAALLIGLVFAFGWTPCIGPVLASILTMAGTTGQAVQGAVLLAVYSFGLGVPFIAAACGYDYLKTKFTLLTRYAHLFEKAGGLLLVGLGLYLIFNAVL